MPPATRWRIDDGEEARLTPEGPTAASIASRGPLAFLRVRVTRRAWGRLLPPTRFRPERVAWERHRAAERTALEAVGG